MHPSACLLRVSTHRSGTTQVQPRWVRAWSPSALQTIICVSAAQTASCQGCERSKAKVPARLREARGITDCPPRWPGAWNSRSAFPCVCGGSPSPAAVRCSSPGSVFQCRSSLSAPEVSPVPSRQPRRSPPTTGEWPFI